MGRSNVIFADLKAYPRGSAMADPGTYEEYLAGDCRLALLVIDCEYAAIYAKDAALRQALYEHARTLGVGDLACMTDENDCRTRLRVG